MIGMILLATAAILVIPPIMMIHKSPPKTKPVISLGTENSVSMTFAMLLIWGIFPDPIAQIIIKAEKSIATHFIFRPFSM